jgi:hypothetical protein
MVLRWIEEPCAPGTASGLPVTLTARLYGPFASDIAASAFAEATSGTPPLGALLAAEAPQLHTDTDASAANEHTLTLLLPMSLPPGVYVCVAAATVHNPGVGSTGSETHFTLFVTAP